MVISDKPAAEPGTAAATSAASVGTGITRTPPSSVAARASMAGTYTVPYPRSRAIATSAMMP